MIYTACNSCAHPGMNWGSRKNQRRTQMMNKMRVAISWNVIGPSSLYLSRMSCLMTTSLPRSLAVVLITPIIKF